MDTKLPNQLPVRNLFNGLNEVAIVWWAHLWDSTSGGSIFDLFEGSLTATITPAYLTTRKVNNVRTNTGDAEGRGRVIE